MGVVPLISMYWGAGAPPGGSRAKQCVLHFSGFVQRSVPMSTLVCCGQGTVYVYLTRGTTTVTLAQGTIREPDPRLSLDRISLETLEADFGYQIATPTTFEAGDRLDIYYVHNGEPWGGIAAKLIPGVAPSTEAFLAALRDAPVIGTSFLSREAAPLPAVPLPTLISADVTASIGGVTECVLTLPLTESPLEKSGFRIERRQEVLALRH